MKNLPERALIIRPEPLAKVFAGTKTWEIRNRPTNIRGPIALIANGSGLVLATCELVDVKGPLRYSEFRDNATKCGGKAADVVRADHFQY
jgi:succinyl-CoA synthetase beta subunit